MTCHDFGLIWPKPTEKLNLSKTLINCLPGDISITLPRTKDSTLIGEKDAFKIQYLPKFRIYMISIYFFCIYRTSNSSST